ncbi:MAG: 2-oxo acid dehydrogenase subunit E2, partial [Anaerolineaceae bacterium]
LQNPLRAKNAMGTIMITTVGMVGHTHGWIMPYSIHPLALALGSINKQPVVRKGQVEIGQILHLTVLIDHDVVDGAPAARFIDDLVRKLEGGWGL